MKIGTAFSDHIKTEKLQNRHYRPELPFSMRPFILLFILVVLPAILFLKLTNLQIVHGSYYRSLSDTNRTRTRIVHAPRGVIFDRHGAPLVYNIPGFREVSGDKTTLLHREEAIELLSKGKENLEIDTLRQYPLTAAAAHVIGYIGQISKEELSMPEYGKYNGTDLIGKSGIENYYETSLRGVDGKELVEVDALGKRIRTLGQTDPIPGSNIILTIDADLQKASYEALDGLEKAVVIASTPTGEILSMVSKPSFDPNLLTMGENYRATDSAYRSVQAILSDTTNQPLLNRAIGGVYPPGSTFKLITAATGLEDGIINKSYTVEDTGVIRVGTFSFANWYFLEQGKKDGTVNVVKAISRSNDIFFYKLAELIKVDKLSAKARKFGVGAVLGIDLAGEVKGTIPSQKWKQDTIGEQWYLGDTYHYGIGQGYLLTTPLQVNTWTQAIANGGTVYQPHLLKKQQIPVLQEDFLSDATITLIRDGMVESCKPDGVGWPLFNFSVKNPDLPIDGKNILAVTPNASGSGITKDATKDIRQVTVACKTGTAQHGGEDTLPHAWITLYAPAYEPEIVVTVLVDSGGQGSSVAGPVAKKVLEAWFGQKSNQL